MDRGILFKTELVRKLSTKTETRRLITPALEDGAFDPQPYLGKLKFVWRLPRYTTVRSHRFGAAGDRLWVREAWTEVASDNGGEVIYRAQLTDEEGRAHKWKPGIHLRRADARILLAVKHVHPERLQAIDDEGARREGFANREDFLCAWDWINGGAPPAGSAFNPWVWVIRFDPLKRPTI